MKKKVTLNKKTQIVDLASSLQPVMPKPFFMDIAGDQIKYPDLTEKTTEKKAGWFGGIFGR